MPLDKLAPLWEDNQFGRKHLFKCDRITASEQETGLSNVLASSDRWWVAVEFGPKCVSAELNPLFLFVASREQHLSDDLWHQNWKVYPSRIGFTEVRCWICQSFALFNQTQATKKLVSLAAVFSHVTQRSSPQKEERWVTRLRTAARETTKKLKKENGWKLWRWMRWLQQ